MGLVLTATPTHASTLVEGFFDLAAPMPEFRCPDDFPPGIIDKRETRRFRSRVDLEPQWWRSGHLDLFLEHDGEGVSAIDCRFP
jgi:hypothetical protein